MKNHICFWLLLVSVVAQAQVTVAPAFPTVDDDITVYFDASQGNAGLLNVPPPIFLHSGVITNLSTSPADWKHVQGVWGQANPAWQLTPLGNNQYSISYNIRTFYGIPQNETVESLAFVFRNTDGSQSGRAAGGADIFYPVYHPSQGFQAALLTPQAGTTMLATLGQTITVKGAASATAMLSLYDNDVLLTQTTGTELNYTIVAQNGFHTIRLVADNGTTQQTHTFTYAVPTPTIIANPPAGTQLGFTQTSDTSGIFALYAPGKQNVFLIGSFNNWQLNHQLHRSVDGTTWWVAVDDLSAGNHTYQYFVDGQLRIADPYSYQVLDPWNDGGISPQVYPNLPPYPAGATTGIVTLLTLGAPAYAWQHDDVPMPKKTDLIVYELLMRDFLQSHDYKDLIDTLDYLQRLGINAIQLMPVNEFEGNNSWGYNPNFHYAIDKYYGTPTDFKNVVDECHRRGMAVIIDVVYNHAFGQSPLAQLYWDATNNRPAANNPWLNPTARHPFNVGNDFNHESQATKDYVNRCLRHWLTEFHVDGFRFDLSKGFTQTNNPTDVGAWGNYDASRIAILKQYANTVWSVNPDAYAIMEHFAANNEEKELAEYGMMLWGNHNYNFNEATMGWTNTDVRGAAYTQRGWTVPHLVAYMESHDEERLMYKNKLFGNLTNAPTYNVRELQTALKRQELASAFFYAIPGPKMLWQFGELGYDFSINTCTNGTVNENCRLDPKPIRWNYYNEAPRRQLYEVTRAMMGLKTTYDVFETPTFDVSGLNSSTNRCKRLHLNSSDLNVTVLGNFHVTSQNPVPNFQHTGWWYDYFQGDSLWVTDVAATLDLLPGEYRVYTDVKLPAPPQGYVDYVLDDEEAFAVNVGFGIAPNPTTTQPTLYYSLPEKAEVTVRVFSLTGQLITTLPVGTQLMGNYAIDTHWQLPAGTYLVQLQADRFTKTAKLIVF